MDKNVYFSKKEGLLGLKGLKVKKEESIKIIQSIVEAFVGASPDMVVITNAHHRDANSVYTLLITKKNMELAQKKGARIDHIFLDFATSKITQNKVEAPQGFVQAFGRKLADILADLNRNYAKLYATKEGKK
jgi:hypothetical protein